MIQIAGFSGMQPKVDERYLPDNAATYSINCRLRSGALVPFRGETTQQTLATVAERMQIVTGALQGYPATAIVVAGPVATDRFYVSGDGAPRVEGSGFSYALAMPPPAVNATVALQAGTVDANLREDVRFTYTWVTTLDEESAPAALSSSIAYSPGVTIRLSGFSTAPTGRAINRKRIYRSVTDAAGGTELFFVAEITAIATTFDYAEAAFPIQNPLPSLDYDTPVASIKGFTAMPNGIIAGFSGRDLYFCEPYIPHAWPKKYSLTTDVQIVALVAFGSTLAVLTTGQPYTVSGIHPDSMAMQKVEENLPCVSARGVVDMGYAAAYPSNDGLVIISSDGPQLVTRQLFTRDDWQAFNPATMVASQYEGRYAFLHDTSAGRKLGFIDLTGEQSFYLLADTTGVDVIFDIATSRLYVLGSDGRTIRRFDSPTGTALTAVWRSKLFQSAQLTNYGAARLDTALPLPGGAVATLAVYDDDVLVDTITTPNAIGRLPGGYLTDRYRVTITTTTTVTMATLGEGIASLMGA